jgi:hypothetical protein
MLMSRRMGALFPCVHTAAQHSWSFPDVPGLTMAGAHEGIEYDVTSKEWFPEARPVREQAVADRPDDAELPIDATEHGRVVSRLLSEMKLLGHGAHFRYTRDDMLYKLGRIHKNVEMRLAGQVSPHEAQILANSEFLVVCARVVKDHQPWSDSE